MLGTGTSHGVPMIGCACATCRSDDPRDRRLRDPRPLRELPLREAGRATRIGKQAHNQ